MTTKYFDRVFSIHEQQGENEVRVQLVNVANKLGLDGVKISRIDGPYTKNGCDDIVYVLKCGPKDLTDDN